MTPQERKLWYMFLRTYPVKFYKQRIIESFIVDFYCHAAKLVIEIDGSQHYEPQGQAYDEERTAILKKYGLEVLRFSNREINTDFRAVCDHIDNTVQARLSHKGGTDSLSRCGDSSLSEGARKKASLSEGGGPRSGGRSR